MILILNEKNILCTDIVELCPIFDNGSTTSIAAKLLSYILAMNKNWIMFLYYNIIKTQINIYIYQNIIVIWFSYSIRWIF